MGLFSKTEKKEMMLDFKLIPPTKGDRETFQLILKQISALTIVAQPNICMQQ